MRAWLRRRGIVRTLAWPVRDRLRCPSCRSIGTWRPHGGPLDREDKRGTPRWLCKWCGFYDGPEGTQQAYVGEHAWTLDEGFTPKQAVRSFFGRPVDPWKG